MTKFVLESLYQVKWSNSILKFQTFIMSCLFYYCILPKTLPQINNWCMRALNVLQAFSQQDLSHGHTNTHVCGIRSAKEVHLISLQTLQGAHPPTHARTHAHTCTHTRTHTHTHTHNVPSSFSREPFSAFNLSFFFSGLLFLLSFPFSFTPFCFLFSPFWVFSAGRHRMDLVDLFNFSLI